MKLFHRKPDPELIIDAASWQVSLEHLAAAWQVRYDLLLERVGALEEKVLQLSTKDHRVRHRVDL